MEFNIETKGGSTIYQILMGDKTHTGITRADHQNGSSVGPIFSFEDGLNAIKTGTKNECRLAWEKAIRTSLDIIETDNVDANLKLHFLRDVIFILVETGRFYVTEPHLLRKLIRAYWTTYNNNDIPDYISIDVCERYLDLLSNDANHDWFEREVAGKNSETSREKETREVADVLKGLLRAKRYRDKKGKEGSLTEDEKEKKKRIEQALVRAKDRFMAWYNLGKAVEIVTLLQGQRRLRFRRFVSGWLPEIIGGLALAYCVCLKIPFLSEAGFRGFTIYGLDSLFCFIYLLILWGMGVSFGRLWRKTKQVDLQIYLPRMAAGIIVGYLALLSDEAWGGIFGAKDPRFWLMAGRVVLPVAVVVFYVLIEMNNVKGIHYPIMWKACRLFFRGASYAILTAVVISDLFGKAIVERIPETLKGVEPVHLGGLFGNVYPEVIFYLAPLALFIGVFVQLLWEDKTLTAKI